MGYLCMEQKNGFGMNFVYGGKVHNRMELSAHVRENECEYGRIGVLVHGGMEVLVYEVQETVFSSSVELCHSLRM